MKIKIADIIIGERQREDLGNLQELADSINNPEIGLLQPIVVERQDGKFLLNAGGRRVAAHILLGLSEIEAMIKDEMTQLQRKRIELEENIRRKPLDWKEEVKAVQELHDLMVAANPGWTAEKTATMIDKSRRTVFNAIELSKAIDAQPEVAAAETPFAAMRKLTHQKQMVQRQQEVSSRKLLELKGKAPTLVADCQLGDSQALMRTIESESIDAIITDPPWGVGFEGNVHSTEHDQYEDDPNIILPIVAVVIAECFRVLKPNRWMIMFWPTNSTIIDIPTTRTLFKEQLVTAHEVGRLLMEMVGFKVPPRPAIWFKPNKRYGTVGNPHRQLNSQYESFFVAYKGDDAKFNEIPQGDVFMFDSPEGDRIHPSQKSVELLETLTKMVSVGGETVLDPFAGSFASGVAAVRQGRNYIGFEKVEQFYAKGRLTVDEAVLGPKVVIPPTTVKIGATLGDSKLFTE